MAEKQVRVLPHSVPIEQVRLEVMTTSDLEFNMVGDYSAAPVRLVTRSHVGSESIHLTRLTVMYADTGPFRCGVYGADGILVNGINITVREANGDLAPGAGQPAPGALIIKKNSDWQKISAHTDLIAYTGAQACITHQLEFPFTGLRLSKGRTLNVELFDDFSFLDEHVFVWQGYQSRL